MDALSLVREATTNNKEVGFEDGNYVFGSIRIHETTRTAFRRTLKSGGYYSLKDVIFYLENAETNEAEYRKKCIAAGVTAVVTQDKSALKQYLTGLIPTCDQIDVSMILSTQQQQQQKSQSHQQQPTTDSSILLSSNNKRKIMSDNDDMTCIDDRDILKQLRSDEKAAWTSNSVLCKPGMDFTFALKLFNEHVLKPKELRAKTTGNDTPASGSSGKKHYASPIIIIPNALTSIITMANVSQFLGEGQYVVNDPKAPPPQESEKLIFHRYNNVNCEFKILDNVTKLHERPDYWDRVVAVFATGQAWQFKNWKWSEPVSLFQNVLGFHLCFADSDVNANIQSWNCKILKISMTQRHLDPVAMNQFWKMLHDYIELNKPWLVKRDSHAAANMRKA